MNTRRFLIDSLSAAALGVFLLASPPVGAQGGAPVPPGTLFSTEGIRATEKVAEVALQQELLGRINHENRPASAESLSPGHFSRVAPPLRMVYLSVWKNSAPGGVTRSPEKIPFELQSRNLRNNDAPQFMAAGYYDAATKKVLLYDAATEKYVTAAEHPAVKPRLRL